MVDDVAFLRGVNVGGVTVKMDRLKTSFEALGFTEVKTLLASGNVLFAAPSTSEGTLVNKIEKSWRRILAVKSACSSARLKSYGVWLRRRRSRG